MDYMIHGTEGEGDRTILPTHDHLPTREVRAPLAGSWPLTRRARIRVVWRYERENQSPPLHLLHTVYVERAEQSEDDCHTALFQRNPPEPGSRG